MPSNNPAPIRLNPARRAPLLKCDLYCALGRQALAVALKALGEGQLGILLPEFICRDVPETCRRMGFAIRWYAVDRQLRPVGLSRHPACRAILAVHYFGFPQDLRPFQAYCRRTGACLIEDAAHGFLSRHVTGKLLGTTGDFGIFSFRKTLPIPNGAALKAGRRWRNVTRCLAKSIGARPASRKLETIRKKIIQRWPVIGKKLRLFLRPLRVGWERLSTNVELQLPFFGLFEVLRAVKSQEEIQRRRRAWKKFHRLGLKEGVRPVFTRLPPAVCPYGYAFRGAARHRSLQAEAKKRGFSVIVWPELPRETRNKKQCRALQVQLVNFLLPSWN